MAAPVLAIRVAANVEELKRNLQEGVVNQIEVVRSSFQRLTNAYDPQALIQRAQTTAAAIQQVGGTSALSADQMARANRVIEEGVAAYERLGQEAPEHLRKLAVETRQTQSAVEAFQERWAVLTASVAGAVASINAVKNSLHEWITESNASENATARLTAALRAQGTFTPELLSQYQAMAAEFQRTSVYADDLTVEMQALLVQVGHVMPGQMEAAVQAAMNLATGLGIDLRSATELLAKAAGTGGESLGRLKAVLGDTKLEGKDLESILAAVNSRFGGQAQAQVQTYAGQMQRLSNEYSDTKEQAGNLLKEALLPMMRAFTSLPEGIQKALLVLGTVAGVVAPVATAIGSITIAVNALIPVLTAAWPAAWAAVTTALGAVAPWLGPAGLIAAGIGAWFVVFKNFDVFVWAFHASVAKLKDAFGVFASAITGFAQAAYNGLKNWLYDRFNAIIDNISARIQWLLGLAASVGAVVGAVPMPAGVGGGGVVPGRASGGPVSAGMPYVVGEQGPELFVPQASGSIVPHGAAGAAITVNLTINGALFSTADQIRQAVSKSMVEGLQGAGYRFPVLT